MKQALQIAIDYMNDRLEDHDCKYQRHPATEAERINILADIETVKEALAKQEHGEPVAWMYEYWDDHHDASTAGKWRKNMTCLPLDLSNCRNVQPLYTTPQQRTWVGLSEEEHTQIAVDAGCMSSDWVFYGAAVEWALKNKNT